MEHIKIESTLISRIGYDKVTRVLEIEFKNNGQVKQFADVDHCIYDYLIASTSKGQFYLKYIEGYYSEK